MNRMGQKECYEYDKVGNLVKSTDSRGNQTIYRYDRNYNILSIENSDGGVTGYTYDTLNRNTSVTDAAGNTVMFTYNKYSLLTEMKDAKGNVTRYEYNEAGNRVKTTYPDGTSVESGYDKRGRTIWEKDAAGIKTEFTYDSADRLTEVDSKAVGKTSYIYDQNGNLASIEDANGNVVQYEYDGQGRLVKTIQPDGSTSRNTYDEAGRPESSTDYNGVVTKYEYDEQDRIIRETTQIPDGSVVKEYTYDKYGRLIQADTAGSKIRYSYNEYGELSEKSYENGQTISYGYDSRGRNNKVMISDGKNSVQRRISYEYDRMNRITRVIAKDGTATVYTYDENGNRETATFANGVKVTYEYDALNRLLVQKTIDRTGELIAEYKYTLGKNGERTKIGEKTKTGTAGITYEYDEAGRLTGECIKVENADGNRTVQEYTYAYDSVGNRVRKTTETDGFVSITEYSYNNRNQLVSETTNGQETVYSYDANGNLLNRSGAAGNSMYTYDTRNRLISYVEDYGAKQETYDYDAEGVRRAKTTVRNGKQEKILFISDTTGELSRTLAETDEQGTVLAAYLWGDTLLAQTRGEKTSTYLYDGHGNVRGLLDEKGILTDTYSYNAYGELTEKTGQTENHFLYTGEYYDGVSGLYYLRARYMNPETGTFTGMDSYEGNLYEPVTLHKYLYANADPVKYKDPSGMFSLSECNISTAVGTMMQNRTAIKSLGILMGVGNAAITAACGGDAKEIMEAFGMGFLAGVGTGILICGVVVLNVISIFEAGAIIATSALWAGLADVVLLSVLMVYSVGAGNEQQIMTYASLLMTAFMEICTLYGTYGQVTVSGEKGSQTVDTETIQKGNEKYQTYYHVTTRENAELIKSSGQLNKGGHEPGIYVWNQRPTREMALSGGLGSRAQVVLKFQTMAPFEDDPGIAEEMKYLAKRSMENTVTIQNIEEVGFKRGW